MNFDYMYNPKLRINNGFPGNNSGLQAPAQVTIEAQSPTQIPGLEGLFGETAANAKTNYARGISNYLLSQGGPFTGLAGMLVGMKADKVDNANSTAAAKAGRNASLAQQVMNWNREDQVADRQRGYNKQDNEDNHDFEMRKLGLQQDYDTQKQQRERSYNVEDRDSKSNLAMVLKNMELSGKSAENSEYEKELQKQRAKQYAELSGNIADGEAGLETLSQSINKALDLNKKARSGAFADARQGVARFFGGGEQTSSGAELQGIMQNELVGQLKKIFGGNITEGEREYLNKLYASDLSMSEGEKEALIRNVYQSAANRVSKDKGAFQSLFGNKQTPEGSADLQGYADKYGLSL